MKGEDGGGSIYGRIGILTSYIRVEFLRFCPLCIEEDRKRFGEPYWHRLHQIPGVEVCPTHSAFLEQSTIPVRNGGNKNTFVTAKQILTTNTPVRSLNLGNRDDQTLLRIAKDAEWLLKQNIRATDLNTLRDRYLVLLLRGGMATYRGRVKISKLQGQFLDFYSRRVLDTFHCGLERRVTWLRRIVQTSRGVHHPMQHLLLLNFLGCSVKEFFQLSTSSIKPFGKAPWPCLNKASDHYGEARIEHCTIKHEKHDKERTIGIFCCDCGFAYRRLGPDKSVEARYRFHRVVSFGSLWEKVLSELYKNIGYSRKEIARRLGVSKFTVANQAKRLGLIDSSSRKLPDSLEVDLQSYEIEREANRNSWLQMVEDNPADSRTGLKAKLPKVYNWLAKNDKEWLESNSPPRKNSTGPKPLTDWKQRDLELAEAARLTAERMKNFSNPPVWASKTAISREIGVLALVYKRRDIIPITLNVLNEVAETDEEFAVRRIRWVVEGFRSEGIRAKGWQIISRASLSAKMSLKPKILSALKMAEQSLES
jgi:hypothetical protein